MEAYNRFQYHKFKWRTFHTEDFHVYFPLGYDSLGKYVAGHLPEVMARVKHRMITRLTGTPNVIIYPSVNQLYESNIGLYGTRENTLPTFIAKGNRMVLFFNGSNDDFEGQLFEAMVRSVWDAQFGSDLESQAKSKGSDAIPRWFKEGAIRYFAYQWPIDAEDELKRSFEMNDFGSWQQVIAYQPSLAGQAFCYFLSNQYYEQSVAQVFGQLKQKRDLRRSIRLIAKKELDALFIQCFEFYAKRFEVMGTQDSTQGIWTLPKKRGIVKTVLPGNDLNNIAYVVSKQNTRTVYNYNVTAKETKKISGYKLPPWINDYSKDEYPLVKWEQQSLMVTQPLKSDVTVSHYYPLGGRFGRNSIAGIDGVRSIQLQDGDYLMAGYRRGQSDIITYHLDKDRFTAHTNDVFDDIYLADDAKQGMYMLSARPYDPDDTAVRPLASGIYALKGKTISRIKADTIDYIKWDKPQPYEGNELLATHTVNGTEQLAIIDPVTGAVKTLGDYRPFTWNKATNKIQTHRLVKDSIVIYSSKVAEWSNGSHVDTISPWLVDYRKREAQRAKEDSILGSAREYEKYSFVKDMLVPRNAQEQAAQREDSIANARSYHPKKVKPYILQLHGAYFTAQANNDYFINRYQPYLNYQGQFKFPELGAMLQAGFSDLFEDHHVGIGFRMPTGTEGSDFFLSYKNTKKNLDWGLTYFRKVETVQPDPKRAWVDESGRSYPNLMKVKTHYYELMLQRPISYYLAVGFNQAVRSDRTIFLATDNYSLGFGDIKSWWSISTLSLKYSKLRPTISMLSEGLEGKVLVDGFKAFSQGEEAFYAASFQAQYHQPLYRHITLVARGQVGHSAGAAHMLYNVGGMDNNVTVKVDSNVQFDQTAPYAFQTLVTPLRGYRQNSLYGNQYAVFNADVYFPVFETLIPIETPLSFINNLQLGLFSDIATAGETWLQSALPQGWRWSYGLNARSKLAGYTLRMDVAWPGALNRKPLWYFSLVGN